MAEAQSTPYWQDLVKGPTLILDEQIVKANIARMAENIRKRGAQFRPHFKTHQSAAVGRWFREVGVTAITTSSLPMAEYFAADGWQDIMIAVTANPRNAARYLSLAEKVALHLIVDHPRQLANFAHSHHPPLKLWIEIDVGDNRSGIPAENIQEVLELAAAIEASPNLQFVGLISHAGYTYRSRSQAEIMAKARESGDRALEAIAAVRQAGYPDAMLSYGDTPSCSTDLLTIGFDELRPGNFVFYDLQQVEIQSCQLSDIGVIMAAPVISLRPELGRVITHGGGVHLSRDFLGDRSNAQFGQVVQLTEAGWGMPIPGVRLHNLSQEHGWIAGPQDWVASLKHGDLLGILPVHSCMAVDCMDYFLTTQGERLEIGHFVE